MKDKLLQYGKDFAESLTTANQELEGLSIVFGIISWLCFVFFLILAATLFIVWEPMMASEMRGTAVLLLGANISYGFRKLTDNFENS